MQTLAHLPVNLEEVGSLAIHFVDEGDPRHTIFGSLTPNRLGLGLNPAHRAINHAGTIKDTHRTFHFDGEIDMPGRVDDVDPMLGIVQAHAPPIGRGGGGGDGDPTLLLLLHPIHGRGTVMHFAYFVIDSGIEQHTLGGRRLTRINMR